MPVPLTDRSGRILQVGMSVRPTKDVNLLFRLNQTRPIWGRKHQDPAALSSHLERFLGCECKIIEIDKQDRSASVKVAEAEDEEWFHDVALVDPDDASATEACSAESLSLELCESLYDDQQFKDITLKLGDGEVRAHKCVLAAASRAFAGMFASPLRESSTGVVELPDCKERTMLVVLRILYTGHADPRDWCSICDGEDVEAMPLDLMLDVVKFAKRYMIDAVLRIGTEAVKARLSDAAAKPEVIETVLSSAIAADLGPVRMAAIKAAESSQALRKKYDEGALRPEVQMEMQAVWPAVAERKHKRVKVR